MAAKVIRERKELNIRIVSDVYKCLTHGLVVQAKDLRMFSIGKLRIEKSQLCSSCENSHKKNEYYLVIYSINPGLMKITAKRLGNKRVEKLIVKTDPHFEKEILSLGSHISELNIIHTTGFCQIEKKVLYEAYFEKTPQSKDIKQKIESYLVTKENVEYTWEKVEIYKRYKIF